MQSLMTTELRAPETPSAVSPSASASSALSAELEYPATAVSSLLISSDADKMAEIRQALPSERFRILGSIENAGTASSFSELPVDVAILIAPDTETLPATIRLLLTSGVADKVVALSPDDEIIGDAVIDVLAAGADGWLNIELSPEALLRSIGAILRGEPALSRRHVTQLINHLREPVEREFTLLGGRRVTLTPREHEILQALVTDCSTKVIAKRMTLSEATVRWYTAKLLRKLDVSSRDDLSALLAAPYSLGRDAKPNVPTVSDPLLPARRLVANPVAADSRFLPGNGVASTWGSLVESERRVVRLVASGMTNREVAETLVLSKHTVDSHLKRAFAKLGVRSRVELTRAVFNMEPQLLTG
jgi:DNA-binding NarL/FixJ family response regulator